MGKCGNLCCKADNARRIRYRKSFLTVTKLSKLSKLNELRKDLVLRVKKT